MEIATALAMDKQNAQRRVGVEIEFSGLKVQEAAALAARELGGEVKAVTPHELTISSPHGDYRMEVDFTLLKDLSRQTEEADEEHRLKQLAVDVLSTAAEIITPLELVSPPLPESALGDLDQVLNALSEAGAQGTGDSLAYAFGVHFNPEAEINASSILRHIQAYCCLDTWLRDRDQTDLARRISGYAEAYPVAYERVVLSSRYQPSLEQLCADYLEHNATRNRALDLLPLIAHIDATLVRQAVDDPRIGQRPTYHYRLPNSQVSVPNWSLQDPWGGWLALRSIAQDAEALAALSRQRLAFLNLPSIKRWDSNWVAQCQDALDPLLA